MHSVNTDALLSNTSSLIDKIYWFEQKITNPAAASHKGIAINYVDIKEMRDGFIQELKSTASNWVYSKDKYRKLLDEELPKRGNDIQNATSYLTQVVEAKFRKGNPQGQFGELLLFNFIQYFFKAPPLLRKMSITTNPMLERNGADAIHYRKHHGQDIFILGESKCYESKYKFNAALSASVSSIIKSFNDIETELTLYQHDDFIQPELQEIAKNLKDNKLVNPRFELVCIVAYDENNNVEGHTSEEIRGNIVKCLEERWRNAPDKLYDGVSKPIVQRINYIVFPIWSLSELLGRF